MNDRRLTTVLSFLVVTAVCGLVLASHPELRQGRKAAHTAKRRGDTSSGAQWRWQNPRPQGNNLRGASVVNANTSTLVGDYVQSSGLPMAEITGPYSLAARRKLCGPFRSQIQVTERLTAKLARSSELRM